MDWIGLQLLNNEEGCEADLEETPGGTGKNLVWSRHEAWTDMCLQKAADFAVKSEGLLSRVKALEDQMTKPDRVYPEEEFMLERFLSRNVHKTYMSEKASSAQALQPMGHQIIGMPSHGMQYPLVDSGASRSAQFLQSSHRKILLDPLPHKDSRPTVPYSKVSMAPSAAIPKMISSDRRQGNPRDPPGVNTARTLLPGQGLPSNEFQNMTSRPFMAVPPKSDNGSLSCNVVPSNRSFSMAGGQAPLLRRENPPCSEVASSASYVPNQTVWQRQPNCQSVMEVDAEERQRDRLKPQLANMSSVPIHGSLAGIQVRDQGVVSQEDEKGKGQVGTLEPLEAPQWKAW